MSDVIVRQWGPNCYAAYLANSGRYPEFVGVECSIDSAKELAEGRLIPTNPGGVCNVPGDLSMGEFGEESDGPRVLDNPGPSAPERPGATP